MKFFMRSFGHTQLYSYTNYILMSYYINEVFMGSFGHTQLYSNGILY